MTVKTGLQRLLERGLHRQETIGLITNHTGLGEDLSRNVDLMLRSGYRVKALFSPEHGIDGDLKEGEPAGNGRDRMTGLPVKGRLCRA